MTTWAKMLCVLVMCLGMGSCTDSDPYFFLNPKMPVSTPFALEKAGNKVSVDFWVLPKRQKLNETQMIGLRYPVSKDLVLGTMDMMRGTEIPLQVKLVAIDNLSETPIALRGASDPNPSAPFGAIANGVAYPSPYRHRAPFQEVIVALFRPPRYGHYRVEVSILKDNVSLKSMPFELFVSDYFGGK